MNGTEDSGANKTVYIFPQPYFLTLWQASYFDFS